jgi:hypothetical protein
MLLKNLWLIVLLFAAFDTNAEQVSFEEQYKALLEKPSSDVAAYRKLRDEYTKLASFDPGYERFMDDVNAGAKAQEKGDFDVAIQHLKKVLQAEPINAPAHWALHLCYQAKKNEHLADLHRRFSDGLLGSIVPSGEFGGPHKPFHIVTRYELYALLDYLSMRLETVVDVLDGDNGYGAMAHVVKNDTGEKGVLYFETNVIENREKAKKGK